MITPHEAIKMAEEKPGLTIKERAKILAIALPEIHKTYVEVMVSWEHCAMVIRFLGFGELPEFDLDFVKSIRREPAKFADFC